jgi:hypothetical protein
VSSLFVVIVFRYIFVTIGKWNSIPIDSNAFLEVYLAIKRHDRKYRGTTIKYLLQPHGKRGSGRENARYSHGCFITYSAFKGELKISHVKGRSEAFREMLKTSRQYGAEIVTSEQEREERVTNAKKLRTQKKVLKDWYL